MKIKQTRQVRLDELLRLVWDGEVVGEKFYDQNNNVLFIGKNDGKIKEADYTCKSDLFTITEEVEITESTILEEMVIVRTIEYKNGDVQKIITLATHKSINDVKGEEDWNKKSILHEVWTVKGNGMGELIWSKESGLIKHLIKIDGELFEIPLKVYNHLEQQKQRADELEKRWNEMKNKTIETI